MPNSPAGGLLALPFKIRLGFAVISALFAALTSSFTTALPWILLVMVLDLGATVLGLIPGLRPATVVSNRLGLIGINAGVAGAAFLLGGVATAPLALIPAYHGGLRHGRRGFVTAYVVAAIASIVTFLILGPRAVVGLPPLLAWLLSVALLGTLGSWSQMLSAEEDDHDVAAREAAVLIARLDEIADDFEGGLDAPAHAAAALDAIALEARSDRSVVLLGQEVERLVPVALHGSTRVPWTAVGASSAVEIGLASSEPTIFDWEDPILGARSVMAVPVTSREGEREGVLMADRTGSDPFSPAELAATQKIVHDAEPGMHAARLFGSLRARAGLEERRRLARAIHDGIAQELAALGYTIDALRMRAVYEENPLADDLDALRASLRGTLADVRGHIADLKMPQRPESGLGAVVGAAVQDFGAIAGIRTTISVKEGVDRLPSHVELLVYRLSMDVLADAQAAGASQVTLSLTVEVPDVHVAVSHDGTSSALTAADLMTDGWRELGGSVTVEHSDGLVRVLLAREQEPAEPGVAFPATAPSVVAGATVSTTPDTTDPKALP